MIFRLLANNTNSEEDRKRAVSYVRNVLGVTVDNDIRKILRVASKFKRRTKLADEELMSIKGQAHSTGHQNYSQSELLRMGELEEQRLQAVVDTVRELPPQLQESLRPKIEFRVKPKIRLY
jgi:pantoate kinase